MKNKILTKKELVTQLNKFDDDTYILIGDDDRMGRNDMNITHIVKKRYDFDKSSESYCVLCGAVANQGCFKY